MTNTERDSDSALQITTSLYRRHRWRPDGRGRVVAPESDARHRTRYHLQKCPGLEGCDAFQCILVSALQCAAKHDRHFRGSVLSIPQEKLSFFMTDQRFASKLRNTEVRVMPDQHDKPRNHPDPDIFAFDTRFRQSVSLSDILCKSIAFV